MRVAASLLLVLASACGRFGFASSDADGGASGDGSDAMPLGNFNQPVVIAEVSDPLTDDDPSITGDGLELYFASERGGSATGYADIYVATRTTIFDPWSAPMPVAQLNSTDEDQSPGITADGLTIYFSSRRPTALISGGSANTWVSTRPDRTSPWSTPQLVFEVSSTFDEFEPQPDASNTHLVFYRQINSTDRDIFISTRTTSVMPWATPVPIPEINTMGIERSPFLTADGLTIWFSSDRASGTAGSNDIYVATRTSPDTVFGTPAPENELNSPQDDDDPSLSADSRIIVFTRATPTNGYEIYEARR